MCSKEKDLSNRAVKKGIKTLQQHVQRIDYIYSCTQINDYLHIHTNDRIYTYIHMYRYSILFYSSRMFIGLSRIYAPHNNAFGQNTSKRIV
jgi:hypothetical protein